MKGAAAPAGGAFGVQGVLAELQAWLSEEEAGQLRQLSWRNSCRHRGRELLRRLHQDHWTCRRRGSSAVMT